MAAVKVEDHIKQDPEAEQKPQPLEDDDFEDTGELDLPQNPVSAWLARIPKWLLDNWNTIDDDEEIQLGHFRKYEKGNKHQLLLNPNLKYHNKLPKQYNVVLTKQEPKQSNKEMAKDEATTETKQDNVRNTFVFSEKDLPGYKRRRRNDVKSETRKDGIAPPSAGVDKNKRFHHFRKTVPKQTGLAATATTEVTCTAVEDDDYRALMRERQNADDKAQGQISILGGDVRNYTAAVLNSGNGKSAPGGFSDFVGNKETKPKPKSQENKASRMPQNELLDLLYDLFAEYPHWYFRDLKSRTQQPEQYLKETLTMIAQLDGGGDFNGTYRLKTTEAELSNIKKKMAAKAEEGDGDEDVPDDESADDDDLEMDDG